MSVAGILTVQGEQYYARVNGDGVVPSKTIQASFDGKIVNAKVAEDRIYSSEYKSFVKRIRISEEQIKYFESKESGPKHKCTAQTKWKFMKPWERRSWHFEQIAEGRSFKFEKIED